MTTSLLPQPTTHKTILAALPAIQETVRLHQAGLSVRQIAAALNVSTQTVYNRLKRATRLGLL